jgi:hypothetical protein
MDFRIWREKLELYLMANGLWGFIEGEDTGNKKTQSTRFLAAYAIISINLTDSAQNVVRRLGSRDPKEVWNPLVAELEQKTPASKMALLELLLGLRCTSTVVTFVSDFQVTVTQLKSMGVVLDEDLTVVMMLRGLPQRFELFVNTIKHKERMPTLDKLVSMICLEDKVMKHGDRPHMFSMPERREAHSTVTIKSDGECPECGKRGRSLKYCWKLHPELAVYCQHCKRQGHSESQSRKKKQQ